MIESQTGFDQEDSPAANVELRNLSDREFANGIMVTREMDWRSSKPETSIKGEGKGREGEIEQM